MTRRLLRAVLGVLLGSCLAGCESMVAVTELGTTVAVATGNLTPEQAESINRSSAAVEKTFEDITPEQEYYIGRTVAATLLHTDKPYSAEAANEYVNRVGQSLALFCDRPELFLGYRFQIMDTDDVNAFGAPGGFILVSRGMLRCCRSEDALAAVLAHEIGHVEKRHGLRAINKSRITSALTTLGAASAENFGGKDLAELTRTFEDSIADVTSALVNSGYSRKYEHEADAAAVAILSRTGYDPWALIDMLAQMEQRLKPGGLDFAKTHPPPKDRIKDIRSMLDPHAPPVPATAARQARFEAALKGI